MKAVVPTGAGTTAAGLLEPGYGDVLWTPAPAVTDRARVTAYLRWLAAERGLDLDGYDALWRWSVRQPGDFWATIWDYFDVLGRPRARAGPGRRSPARRALVPRRQDQLRP